MKNFDYDILVIGGGIAGFVAAVTACGLGQKVGIVEKRKLGGSCTSFTCIPSKALIRAAHAARQWSHLGDVGLSIEGSAALNADLLMPHIRDVVQKVYEKDRRETFEKIGIRVFLGNPEFIDNYHVVLDGQPLSAKKFIIATGTCPLVPPIEGLDKVRYLTNETVFELNALPSSMIILGGGVDGLEFASAFGRLGVKVTLVEMGKRLLPSADKDLAELLLRELRRAGIDMLLGTKAVSFSAEKGRTVLTVQNAESQRRKIEADAVLVTIGRKANVDGIALEKAGVKYTPKGISTNDKLQTSSPNIYACGDIVGPYQLASIAEYQGIMSATNAVLPVKRKLDYENAVFVIFTDPPVAYVGLTEEKATVKYMDKTNVYRFDYSRMRRAIVDGAQVGLAKFICGRNGRLLGAHIIGEAAGEVIHEAQVIKALKIPLHSLYSVTHAYPTYAQALVGRASQLAYFDRIERNFFVRQALRFWPGLDNQLALARNRLAETEEALAQDEDIASKEIGKAGIDEARGKEVKMKAVRVSGESCIVDLPAELSSSTETSIMQACSEKSSGRIKRIILNFGAVEIMNCLGASMLVKLGSKVKRSGLKLSAYGVSAHYRDVLRLTALDKLIRIYDGEDAALAAARDTSRSSPSDIGATSPLSIKAGDEKQWAKPISKIAVPAMPPDSINLNVAGRRIVGPVDGFGPLWQKTYRLSLIGKRITPRDAIGILKENFTRFQPPENRFYTSAAGMQPGDVVLINSSTPGGPVYTGVVVLYADEQSFAFITPQGHPESGWVTFSAFDEHGNTVVQVQGLARASDPIYEIAFRLVGSKVQEGIWRHLLESMAEHVGVKAEVDINKIRVDAKFQWSQSNNVWYNAQIRSMLYALAAPFRRIGSLFKR
jgi:anti-anti-sigma factor